MSINPETKRVDQSREQAPADKQRIKKTNLLQELQSKNQPSKEITTTVRTRDGKFSPAIIMCKSTENN